MPLRFPSHQVGLAVWATPSRAGLGAGTCPGARRGGAWHHALKSLGHPGRSSAARLVEAVCAWLRLLVQSLLAGCGCGCPARNRTTGGGSLGVCCSSSPALTEHSSAGVTDSLSLPSTVHQQLRGLKEVIGLEEHRKKSLWETFEGE